MRKALIGLVLAATVLTPLAAQAQERGERRSRHVQQEDSAGSSEQRAQRQEYRQQRQQQRAQVQQQRVQVQQQAQPQVQVAQRDRRSGGGWRGNDGNRGGGDRGSWQGNRGDDRGSRQSNGGDRGNWRGGAGSLPQQASGLFHAEQSNNASFRCRVEEDRFRHVETQRHALARLGTHLGIDTGGEVVPAGVEIQKPLSAGRLRQFYGGVHRMVR